MMILTYIIAAVVLLGLCIFVHELGHLLGGRMVGIKAKVFSMGYGRGILKKQFGDTTYQVTLIPFGGYCQFYGEDPSEERSGKEYEFLSAAPWRRIVTVAMGPLFNLIFGVLLFFAMNMTGYTKETNRIFIPEEYRSGEHVSVAYQAGMRDGDRIVSINNRKIRGFDDIQMQVFFSEGRKINIQAERGAEKLSFDVAPVLSRESGRYALGVLPYGNRILIADVSDGDIAEIAGLRQYDEVLNIDGKELRTPDEFTDYIKARTGQKVAMTVLRNGDRHEFTVAPRTNTFIMMDDKPAFDTELLKKMVKDMSLKLNGQTVFSGDDFIESVRRESGKKVTLEVHGRPVSGIIRIEERGFIGVYLATAPDSVDVRFSVGEGLVHALVEPYEFIVMNLKGLGMLFTGKMDVRENLSGPIRIAKIAGDVAYYKGVSAFIILMAKISIILMVMNLLPIPAVDGSHLVFYTIEAIRGKPLDQKIMERIQTVGVLLLITLGIFVIINDISMLPVIQKLFN
jgi:regulator of sigma E protease